MVVKFFLIEIKIRPIYGFPEYLVLWARLGLSALPGKLERNRGGEATNRAEKPGPMAPD